MLDIRERLNVIVALEAMWLAKVFRMEKALFPFHSSSFSPLSKTLCEKTKALILWAFVQHELLVLMCWFGEEVR